MKKTKWYTWVFSGIGVFVLSVFLLNGIKTENKGNAVEGQQNIFSGNFKGDITVKNEQGLNAGEKEKLDFIHKSVKQLIAKTESDFREALAKKYPLGYMLFGVYDKEVIVRETSEINGNFSFIWDEVKILEITNASITIVLPGIYDKRHHNTLWGNGAVLPLKEGFVFKAMQVLDTGVVVELLNKNSPPYIFVIAFEKAL